MKETSTHSRLWKMYSKDFVQRQQPFKIYHVENRDEAAFCKTLIAGRQWTMERKGSSVIFSPPV